MAAMRASVAPVTTAAAVLVLVFVGTAPVHSWGPITHYDMTCRGIQQGPAGRGDNQVAAVPTPTATPCVADPARAPLLTGTEMPDAFFFGSFVTGSNCTTYGYMHDLVFAGHQVLSAKSMRWKLWPDALQYALGFGAHVVADVAGFFPGGYLGTGRLPASGGLSRDWLALWPFMTAVDGVVYANASLRGSHPFPPTLPTEGAQFVAAAVAEYHALNPAFPSISADMVSQCASAWHDVVSSEISRATDAPAGTYEWQLVYNDLFQAANYAEAVSHLEMAQQCAVAGIRFWQEAIIDRDLTPEAAANATFAMYVDLFAKGHCAPRKPQGDALVVAGAGTVTAQTREHTTPGAPDKRLVAAAAAANTPVPRPLGIRA